MAPSIGIMMLPGCHCAPIETANWYKWLANELQTRYTDDSVTIICETMPDPIICSESLWMPFILEKLEPFEIKIVVGHSSGALAAMRLAESEDIFKTYLVSPALSDGGCENERASGYYPDQMDGSTRPWDWTKMLEHTSFIVYAGEDDHLIPIKEMREVAGKLNLTEGVDYIEFRKSKSRGHFLRSTFPELLEEIEKDLNTALKK